MPRKTAFLLTLFLACALLALTPHPKPQPPAILYVPLDNRPVNYDFVHSLNRLTPFRLLTPPQELLNSGEAETDPGPLWDWLRANASSSSVMVLSLDALLYGGLVPSRNHHLPPETLASRLKAVQELSAYNVPILAFATVLRSQVSAASFGHPEYFAQYGSLLNLLSIQEDKADRGLLSPAEQRSLAALRQSIPAAVLADHLRRRALNHRLLAASLRLAKEGAFSFIVLAKDDTAPFSHSSLELRRLAPLMAGLGDRAVAFPGADEIGMMLYARAVNLLNNRTPRIHAIYAAPRASRLVPHYEDISLEESLRYRLLALGAVESGPDEADLLLFVNTPEEGFAEAAAQDPSGHPAQRHHRLAAAIAAAVTAGRPAALADVAYSNGADAALLSLLAEEKLLSSLASFAGWNTAGNSLGTALAHGLLYSCYRARPGFDRQAHHQALQLRLLEDWGYQSRVRPRVAALLGLPHGGAPIPPEKKDFAISAIKAGLAEFSGEYFPANFQSWAGIETVGLPWGRLFDLRLATGRPKKTCLFAKKITPGNF